MTWFPGKPRDSALFSGGIAYKGESSAPTTTTTIQKSDPWSGQMPYLTDVFGKAQGLSKTPVQYFPGQTFVSPSDATKSAIDLTTQRAENGSPLNGASQGSLLDTLQGKYLDPNSNPAFGAMADAITAKTLPTVTAPFEATGRFGSGLAARAAGEGVASALAAPAYQSMNDERQRMLQSSLLAPTAAGMDYTDLDRLLQAGQTGEAYDAQKLQDQIDRFNFGQMEPWQRLGMYDQLVQGNYGGSVNGTTVQTPPRTSGASNLIGAGLGTAGLLSMLLL